MSHSKDPYEMYEPISTVPWNIIRVLNVSQVNVWHSAIVHTFPRRKEEPQASEAACESSDVGC